MVPCGSSSGGALVCSQLREQAKDGAEYCQSAGGLWLVVLDLLLGLLNNRPPNQPISNHPTATQPTQNPRPDRVRRPALL